MPEENDEGAFDPNNLLSWIGALKSLNENLDINMGKVLLKALVGEAKESTSISIKAKGIHVGTTTIEARTLSDETYLALPEQEVLEKEGFARGDEVVLITVNKEIFAKILMKMMEDENFEFKE